MNLAKLSWFILTDGTVMAVSGISNRRNGFYFDIPDVDKYMRTTCALYIGLSEILKYNDPTIQTSL